MSAPDPGYAPLVGMTLDAAGNIGALFPGGLEILAGNSDTPPEDRRIRWVRESDGALMAYTDVFELFNVRERRDVMVDVPGASAFYGLDNGAGLRTGITGVHTPPVLDKRRVDVDAGAETRTLLDENGASVFPQLPTAAPTRELYGRVLATGAIADAGSGGWTITKGAAGAYTINFTAAFATGPTVLVTPVGVAPFFARTGTPATNNCVVVLNTAAGVATDNAFSFRALGAL